MNITEVIKLLQDGLTEYGDVMVLYPDMDDDLVEVDSYGWCKRNDKIFAIELWNEGDNQSRDKL